MASILKDYLLERMQIDLITGCWNWKNSLAGGRYGTAWFEGRKISAHRASYEVFVGEIPEGLNACHKCDNTRCINPYHIFLGTQKDNIQDCIKKGRMKSHKGSFLKGENHRMAKLSEENVNQIRSLLKSRIKQIWIAREFGIDQSTVSDIKRQKRWKYIGVQNEL